jgi:enoyl-[acyl-carrier-protein] reductase (NADH)
MAMQIDFIKNHYKLIERKMIYQLDIFCRDNGDNNYNEIIDDFGDNFIVEGMLHSGLTDYIKLNDTGRFMHDYIDMSQKDYKIFYASSIYSINYVGNLCIL